MINKIKKLINEVMLQQTISSMDYDKFIEEVIDEYEDSYEDVRMVHDMDGYYDILGVVKELQEKGILNKNFEGDDIESILKEVDEEDIIETDRFKKFRREEIRNGIRDVKDNLENDLERDNKYVYIYRVIGFHKTFIEVVENLKKEGKHLGIHWTESYRKAYQFGRGNVSGNRLIFKIKIKDDYINWEDTLKLRLDSTLGWEEKEIRLFKNTPIKIENIYIYDYDDKEELDISSIRDKVFYA